MKRRNSRISYGIPWREKHTIPTRSNDERIQLNEFLVNELLRQHKTAWRLSFAKNVLLTTFFALGVGYYVLVYAKMSGLSINFSDKPFIGAIRIEGEISSGSPASADNIVPALRAAMEDDDVKAVALLIDSPGGAPLEAERITATMAELRKEHDKPIYAVIENVGASAAYMVAMHADKVYSGRYSLVGSIGAVMQTWDVHKALQRYDINQVVYASGKLKAQPNPFTPRDPAYSEKAQELVNQAGGMFVADLQERRGSKLQAGMDYGTGEVWSGQQAKEIGLVDELGTIDVIAEREKVRIKNFGPGEKTITPFASEMRELLARTLQTMLNQILAKALNPSLN